MAERKNYRYSNPCCWCAHFDGDDPESMMCSKFETEVLSLYTCDDWEEEFEE